LHTDMLTLAGRIPPQRLADRRQTKKVLKSALRSWLPESILGRRKMGFAMPLGRWVRGELSQLFRENTRRNLVDDLLDERLLKRISEADSAAADGTEITQRLFFVNWRLPEWAVAR